MRIRRFVAIGVHRYLDFDIEFNKDLTFLIGINGSGKTSVLRLIQGLLGPLFFETVCMPVFKEVQLTCELNAKTIDVRVHVEDGKVYISVTGAEQPLELPILEGHPGPRTKEGLTGRLAMLAEESQDNAVLKCLHSIPPPMFLGLDRRSNELAYEDPIFEIRMTNMRRRRMLSSFSGNLAVSLSEVQALATSYVKGLRTAQERYGEELRRKIILSAFKYEPVDSLVLDIRPLKRKDSQQLDAKRQQIVRAARSIGFEPQELDEHITPFLSRMEHLSKELSAGDVESGSFKKYFAEWIVNRPQVDRLDTLIGLIEEYNVRVQKLFEPVESFLETVNSFLGDSGKALTLTANDELAIGLPDQEPQSIQALSSGERQIVVMLAHLAFNKTARAAGVFIIDEPELSLHLRWQELFVKAIQKTAPDVQLILATHAPSIVLEKGKKCVDLSKRVR